MSLRETVERTDWRGIIVASGFLWAWLHLGRWLTGQPQFPSSIAALTRAFGSQDIGVVLVNLGLCFLGTLMLAWIQIRRQPEDLAGAGLLGLLAAIVPVAFLIGDASRSGRIEDFAPGIAILLTGLVGTSVVLHAVRNR